MIHLRVLLASLTLGTLSLIGAESTSPIAASDPAPRTGASLRNRSVRAHSLVFAVLDTDRNGVLSSSEMANAPTVLQALDIDDDGMLSAAELRRDAFAPPTRADRRFSPFNVAFTLDANRDGEIQMMEIANAGSSLKLLDANNDGEVTPDELGAAARRPQTVAQR